MRRAAARSVPLTPAVDALGLPRWTSVVIAALPVGIAVTFVLRNSSSLSEPIVLSLLLVAMLATIGPELPVLIPQSWMEPVGIGAIAPLVVAGGNRLVLVIAGVFVLRGAAFASQRVGVAVALAAIGLTITAGAISPGLALEPVVIAGMSASWFAGMATRRILRLVEDLRDSEQLLSEEVAREERRKLAREVHDVIAHSMTVTLLHLNGARLALHDDLSVAEEALRRAERVGRASLEDLRRTVRLLSESTDSTLGVSVNLAEDLERLREGFASAGAEVSLELTGFVEDASPFVALTVFRIVQESMTNAIRHAQGCCVRVDVAVEEERVTIRVENSMGLTVERNNGSGRGLHGMFERAAILGGHVEAGPTKDGWLVAGWVPRDAPLGGLEVGARDL